MNRSGWPNFSVILLDPWASSLPNPSRYAVFSAIATRASALPKSRGIPVCSWVTTPFSYSSIAAARVPPKDIGSMPRSLQSQLALIRASRSLIPQSAPMAHPASYSGPSPDIFQLRGWVVTMYLSAASPGKWVTRPQAMVQAKQALGPVRRVSVIRSPLISSTSANWDSWWLLAGRPPCSFIGLNKMGVPYTRSPSPVIGDSFSFFLAAQVACIIALGEATATPPVPRTAMALRFLEPMTAPTPLRPAARCLSFMIDAKRTRFSPAGPMHETMASWTPVSALMVSSVSQTPLPHRCCAGTSWTSSSYIHR